MKSRYELKSLEDMENMIKDIAHFLKNHIIFLIGDMGAGKTTFVKYFMKTQCGTDDVYSPTFSIENRYGAGGCDIIHFDLYRLEDAEELETIGFYDSLKENATIFIEWADKFDINRSVKDYKSIYFKIGQDGSRSVSIE